MATMLLLAGDVPSAGTSSDLPVVYERGGFNYLVAMSVIAPDDIVAVGGNALVRYDGVGWRLDKTFEQVGDWNAVDTKGGYGWAVGSPCAVLRIGPDVSVYEHIPLMQCALLDVAVTSSGQAWAVGSGLLPSGTSRSLILHFNGNAWSPIQHEYVRRISTIWMLSDAYGWAAGQDDTGLAVFFHWDGTVWKRVVSPAVPLWITAIDGVDERNIWAVGGLPRLAGDNGSAAVIMRFSGDSWSVEWLELANAPGMLWDVKMVSPVDGWAVGEHYVIYRFDGLSWSLVQGFGGGSSFEDFMSIGIVAPDDVWIGGNLISALHYKDGMYTSWNGYRGRGMPGLTSISVLSDGSGWAVGEGGPVLRRDESGWQEVSDVPFASSMTRVVAINASSVWASLGAARPPGRVAHYNGESWSVVQLPTQYPVVDFSALGEDAIWAVASRVVVSDEPAGEQGADILHFDGRQWVNVYSVLGVELRSIYMIDEDHGWAVGSVVLKSLGDEWLGIQVPEAVLPRQAPLFLDVAFDTVSHGWFIAGTYALEYKSGNWRRQEFDFDYPQDRLHAITITPDGQAWIAGGVSNWHYNGLVWSREEIEGQQPVQYSFEAVDVVVGENQHTVWIAGEHDSIARVTIERAPPVRLAYLPIALRP